MWWTVSHWYCMVSLNIDLVWAKIRYETVYHELGSILTDKLAVCRHISQKNAMWDPSKWPKVSFKVAPMISHPVIRPWSPVQIQMRISSSSSSNFFIYHSFPHRRLVLIFAVCGFGYGSIYLCGVHSVVIFSLSRHHLYCCYIRRDHFSHIQHILYYDASRVYLLIYLRVLKLTWKLQTVAYKQSWRVFFSVASILLELLYHCFHALFLLTILLTGNKRVTETNLLKHSIAPPVIAWILCVLLSHWDE